jgi:hypothetical protein
MKTVIERILADEKIRDIVLGEEMPYPASMKGNYPGKQGDINQQAVDTAEHPKNKEDLGANVSDATPGFTSTTGGAAKGLPAGKAQMRSGSVNLRGSDSGKAGSAKGKIVVK